MFEKNNRKYNPVMAPVPGVDQQQREDELIEISMAGDPLPSVPPHKEKEVIFKKFGIKILK
jgi:hypothetical protein